MPAFSPPCVIHVSDPELSPSLAVPGGALREVLAFPGSVLSEPQTAETLIFSLTYKQSINMYVLYSSMDSGQNIVFISWERSDYETTYLFFF